MGPVFSRAERGIASGNGAMGGTRSGVLHRPTEGRDSSMYSWRLVLVEEMLIEGYRGVSGQRNVC